MQRGVAELVVDVDPDALVQQEPDHVDLPEVGRHVQGGVPGLRLKVAVATRVNLGKKLSYGQGGGGEGGDGGTKGEGGGGGKFFLQKVTAIIHIKGIQGGVPSIKKVYTEQSK